MGAPLTVCEEETQSIHSGIVGSSPEISRVMRLVQVVAPTDSTVLISGETGTGKELVARAIHNSSDRCRHAFVEVNCAAIPRELLESELFGHEKGAFTGALASAAGRFEVADHGTVFLDEIGDMPLDLQPKLLHVLQEHEFERLGSTRTHRVDVRLVAATNQHLPRMIREHKFRSDLFYRLSVFPIAVPPLRKRKVDIPLLVEHFVQAFARKIGKRIDSIHPRVMDTLVAYDWPGNVRELKNVVERSVILASDIVLEQVEMGVLVFQAPTLVKAGTYNEAIETSERQLIIEALRQSNWVVGGPHGAAAKLGLKRTSLAYKMRRLGISRGENVCNPHHHSFEAPPLS